MDKEFSDGIRKLLPALSAYATLLTQSATDGEDLVQDTLVRAWRFRHGFQSGTNLRAWMFKIMRNEFLSQVQRYPKRAVHLSEGEGYELRQEPDQEWRRLYSDVLRALSDLSEPSREALLLVSACGFSYQEAAEMCDCALGTIKSRVSRARDRVAVLLGDDGGDVGMGRRPDIITAPISGPSIAMQRHY